MDIKILNTSGCFSYDKFDRVSGMLQLCQSVVIEFMKETSELFGTGTSGYKTFMSRTSEEAYLLASQAVLVLNQNLLKNQDSSLGLTERLSEVVLLSVEERDDKAIGWRVNLVVYNRANESQNLVTTI